MSSPLAGRLRVSPAQLFVRCFSENKRGQWQAFSLEYGLAAQAETREEVRAKLESMIACYVEDALVGEDARHGAALLHRKSTAYVWFKYHVYALLDGFRSSKSGGAATVFERIVPLVPTHSAG